MEKVHDYIKQQNRPFSVNDIFSNLHKELGKTAVQKALDSLVQCLHSIGVPEILRAAGGGRSLKKGVVKEKSYGKQKVYVVDQNDIPAFTEQQLKELDCRISQLKEDLNSKLMELKETGSMLKNLESSFTIEEAQLAAQKLEEEIEKIEKEVSSFQSSNAVIVSSSEKERIEADWNSKTKERKKRKRMATDILDAILEGYPKTKKELFKEIGIETDEDVGVTF